VIYVPGLRIDRSTRTTRADRDSSVAARPDQNPLGDSGLYNAALLSVSLMSATHISDHRLSHGKRRKTRRYRTRACVYVCVHPVFNHDEESHGDHACESGAAEELTAGRLVDRPVGWSAGRYNSGRASLGIRLFAPTSANSDRRNKEEMPRREVERERGGRGREGDRQTERERERERRKEKARVEFLRPVERPIARVRPELFRSEFTRSRAGADVTRARKRKHDECACGFLLIREMSYLRN